MKFNELKINPKIIEALDEIGYQDMMDIQSRAIPEILKGVDVVARSQTGSGKTLAFGIPIVNNIDFSKDCIQSLVLCPTRELAMQVSDEIRRLTTKLEKASIVCVYGGSDIRRQIVALKKKPKIVVGTPGRVMDHLGRKTLNVGNISTFVLDEADEMLNMGFKEDIEQILKSVPNKRQTLMFSATFPTLIKNIVKNYLKNPVNIEVGEKNQSLSNINQQYVFCKSNSKTAAFFKLIAEVKPNISIVFCNTKRMVEQLKDQLIEAKYNAFALHGDMRQRERTQVMKEVKLRENIFLVATDVAARGIDINNVDYIVNYDLPNNVEYYLHRIGRTARAGRHGTATTLINRPEQLGLLKQFERDTKSTISELMLGGISGKPDKKLSAPFNGKDNVASKKGLRDKNSRRQSASFQGKASYKTKPYAKEEKFASRKKIYANKKRDGSLISEPKFNDTSKTPAKKYSDNTQNKDKWFSNKKPKTGRDEKKRGSSLVKLKKPFNKPRSKTKGR